MTLPDIGPYRVLEQLKSGGQGAVYAAEDSRLGRTVAIKLRPLPTEPEARRTIVAEAELLAQLSHPHVVSLYDVLERADSIALVMEFVAGEDLATRLTRGALGLEETIQVGVELCGALAASHGVGIVHGDLKPANVLVDGGGRVKLTDFGVAARPGDDSITGGSPSFMAPERLAGAPPDVRSDLFALGCLLYGCLTGAHPVSEPVTTDGSGKALSNPGVDLPPALETLLQRLLAEDPAERPGSAQQVRQVLLGIALSPRRVRAQVGGVREAGVDDVEGRRDAGSRRGHALSRRTWAMLAAPVCIAPGVILALWLAWSVETLPPPTAVVLLPPTVQLPSTVSAPTQTELADLLSSAVDRHSGLQGDVSSGPGAGRTTLGLVLRCNAGGCVTQLVRQEGNERWIHEQRVPMDLLQAGWDQRLAVSLQQLFPAIQVNPAE